VILTLTFDPNQYKAVIVQTVKDKTGRELKIDGKIGLTFFPWIGVEASQLALGNAPGFGPQPFAKIDTFGVKVKLLPLLRREIAVDTVVLTGFELALARNAQGVANWDDLLAAPKAEPKPTPGTPPAPAAALPALAVNGIEIRKANLTWHDATSGARYALRNLDLKTGPLALKQPVDVALGFDVESGKPPVRTRLDLKTRASFDPERDALEVSSLTLTLGELKLTGELKGSRLRAAPSFTGRIDVAAFDAKALLHKLGIGYAAADKNALTRVAVKTQFAASTQDVALKDLAVTLDDSRLTGSVAIQNFTKPAYRAELALDRIDVDRYLPAPTGAGAGKATPAPPGAAAALIPVETLRALDAQARFRVGKLKAYGAQLSDAQVQVNARGGLVQIGPNQAKLYEGSFRGTDTIDVRGAAPKLAFEETVSGVQLAPLLKDVVGIDKFSGAANITAKLTAAGATLPAIKSSLGGNAQFNVKDGVIQGVDLKRFVDTIDTAIKQKKVDALAELSPKAGDQTRFTKLGGTARVQAGVLHNDDLRIDAPGLTRIAGQGTVDLGRDQMNYVLTLGSVPVRIEGPFAGLKFRPDTKALVKKELEGAAEKKIEKLIDRLKKR
jgi:AsmA protein